MNETTVSRADHLAWCKRRAAEYIKAGDANQAWASFLSDMGKHPETKDHAALQLGMMMLMGGMMRDTQEVSKFIEGFN